MKIASYRHVRIFDPQDKSKLLFEGTVKTITEAWYNGLCSLTYFKEAFPGKEYENMPRVRKVIPENMTVSFYPQVSDQYLDDFFLANQIQKESVLIKKDDSAVAINVGTEEELIVPDHVYVFLKN